MKRSVLNLGRFYNIWKINFKARLMSRLEFRLNFILILISSFSQFFFFAVGVRFIYSYAGNIAGWTFEQALAVASSFYLIDGLLWFICSHHVSMSHLVRQGILDFILIKPIDSQFSVSTHRGDPEDLMRVITALATLYIAVKGLDVGNHFFAVTAYIFAIICATAIYYSISLSINSVALWITDTWGVWSFFDSFSRLGQYPSDIFYHKIIQIIFYSAIPIAFLATVPAKMIIGTGGPKLLFSSFILAVIFLYGSRRMWQFAIRRYSSASS